MLDLRLLSAVAALALSGCAHAPEPASRAPPVTLARAPFVPDSGSIAVHCATLIDGLSAQPAHDVTVVIRGGRIASVDSGLTHPKDLPWLDLPRHTCLPGLIDMHVHITEAPEDLADMTVYLRRTDDEVTRMSREQAEATLQAGFTTVRNVGNYKAWADRDLRDRINRGEVAGPRMQVVGFYLTIPHGGGDLYLPSVADADVPARFHMGVSRGPEQFARNAQLAVDGGADLLKVIASGAVLAYGGVPGAPEMTPEEIAAVVKVAHAAGLKVAAHAHGAQSIRDAILAGVDTVEHASLIDDEGIALAREPSRGVVDGRLQRRLHRQRGKAAALAG